MRAIEGIFVAGLHRMWYNGGSLRTDMARENKSKRVCAQG